MMKLQDYRGPAVRYRDGELGLSCAMEVRSFAAYLRKQSAQHPDKTCSHRFGCAADPRGFVSLVFENLSIEPGKIQRPWSRGTIATVEFSEDKQFDADCELSELASHIEWYWGFSIGAEYKACRRNFENQRRRRKEEIRQKMIDLEKEKREIEAKFQETFRTLESRCKWQLLDEEEMGNGAEGAAVVAGQGHGNTAAAAAAEIAPGGARHAIEYGQDEEVPLVG